MCKVRVIKAREDCGGMRLRRETVGPESSMVAAFADALVRRYESMGGTSRVLVVFEPLLDSGYPDIVVLRYTTEMGMTSSGACATTSTPHLLFLHDACVGLDNSRCERKARIFKRKQHTSIAFRGFENLCCVCDGIAAVDDMRAAGRDVFTETSVTFGRARDGGDSSV